MPTTSQNTPAKGSKQNRTPDVQPSEGENAGGKPVSTQTGQPKLAAPKQDKERSDWEGMTQKPDQDEDDIAAPGQLPETD